MALPTLFISHGAPTLLTDPTMPGAALRQLGQRLPRPHAILVMSAHWFTDQPTVSNAEQPETIYDFYGFPAELYKLRYAAPGSPRVAERVLQTLAGAGFTALQQSHGLDHGAWVPLSLLFPDADIPVLQLSVQPKLNPSPHWQVGKALQSLRDEGILIIGAGQITHNLRELNLTAQPGEEVAWTKAFVDWMQQRISNLDKDALLDYRRAAP